MESEACCSNEGTWFSVCNECPALLEQVPETFFLGTTHVGLRCLDVSLNYIVFGSDCGALFPFNRRLNRSATPLRTHYDEVVTCVRLFSSNNDMLAAGHESGIFVVLRFPSNTAMSRRKIQQHLDPNMHQGHAVTCIEWSTDGSRVFSSDSSGAVYVTNIDFEKEFFESKLLCSRLSCILQISYATNFLAVNSENEVLVMNLTEKSQLMLQDLQMNGSREMGICIQSADLSVSVFVGLDNGYVYHYDGSAGTLRESLCLSSEICSPDATVDKKRRCKVFLCGDHLLYCCDRDLVLLSIKDEFHILSSFRLHDLDPSLCVVEDIALDFAAVPEIFMLTSDKRVFRISSAEAPQSLRVINGRPRDFNPLSVISSIQKTTKLLPFAPTKAILSRFKPNGDLYLSSLPNLTAPVLGTVLSFGGVFINNSTSTSDLKLGNFDKTPRDQNDTSKANDTVSLSRGWFRNVNEASRYVVDVVGGAGIPVREGLFTDDPVCSSDCLQPHEQNFPESASGAHDEVLVQRTLKIANKRKLSDSLPSISGFDTSAVSVDAFTPVDDTVLNSIREALCTASSNTIQNVPDNSSVENKEEMISSESSSYSHNTLISSSVLLQTSEQVQHKDLSAEQRTDQLEVSSCNTNVQRAEVESTVSQHAAYEELMRQALRNKQPQFKTLTDEIECFEGEFNENVTVFCDKGDIWSEIRLPFACSSFCATSKYFLICGAKKGTYPQFILLSKLREGNWLKMRHKGELVIMNDENSLVWRVQAGVAYAPNIRQDEDTPLLLSPHWHAVANEVDGIVEVSLTRDTAWYITKLGQVYAQLRLPEMGILSRCESPWPLRSITASEVAVWAIKIDTGRLVVRAGLKHCPIGLDWVEIEPEGPTRLLNICLFGQSGWAIDSNFCLWFTNGVDLQSPFGTSGVWLQACCPWSILPEVTRYRHFETSVKVSSFGVFVSIGRKVFWSSSKSLITGHSFKRIVPDKLAHDDCFGLISAGSLNLNDTGFISLSRSNELYLFRMKSKNFCSLPVVPSSPSASILQICSVGDSIYVLDSSGCIYVKKSVGKTTPFGLEWKVLDTGQFGSLVKSFAVTSCSIWVLTLEMDVYMHPRVDSLDPCVGTAVHWKHIGSSGLCADQIRASNSGTYVWIYSSIGRAWARSCINERCPSGKTWVEASSENVVAELAVGSRVIWMLSTNGQLYRLRGLSASNPAGNYWKAVPKKLKAISLDANDHLWGIDLENRLVYHKVEVYPSSFDRTPTSLQQILASGDEEKDFVIF